MSGKKRGEFGKTKSIYLYGIHIEILDRLHKGGDKRSDSRILTDCLELVHGDKRLSDSVKLRAILDIYKNRQQVLPIGKEIRKESQIAWIQAHLNEINSISEFKNLTAEQLFDRLEEKSKEVEDEYKDKTM